MLGLVPTEIELRVRRLGWLQQIALHIRENTQLLAALFGRLPGEPTETLKDWQLVRDDAGKLHGNPWALQAVSYTHLRAHETGAYL
eukprot:1699587-Pyramimonas_sp.AAC.1